MALTAADIPFASVQSVPKGWRLLDDVELMTLADPEFLIDGILPRKGVGVLYGPSGACKTTLVAGAAVAIATGRNWFNHQISHRGASAYVATEDPGGFKVRLRAAKIAAGLPLDRAIGIHTFPEPIDLRDAIGVGKFIRLVLEYRLSLELVIIDTYAAATPGSSENSSEDMTTAMAAAQRIRDELGCAVLLVHHTNAGGSRERGHSSMRGAADVMISCTPVDDVIHVECSKQRNGSPFAPILLKLEPVPEGGCVLRFARDVAAGSGLTVIQDKAFSILRDTFAATGATKTEWRSACQDIAERSFHRAAKVLVERGLVAGVGSHFRVTAQEVAS